MILIQETNFSVHSAGLTFHLMESLHIPEHSWVSIHGENGVGKSTFLEHVLIPQIHPEHSILYLAQDFDLQIHTIRSTLALLDKPICPSASKEEIVQQWMQCAVQTDVLIMDEFEKYVSTAKLLAILPPALRYVFSVSHLDQGYHQASFPQGYELLMQRTEIATTSIRLSQLW